MALAVDRTRVAILWADGTAEVRAISGARLALLHVGAARAVALDGGQLAVLRGSRLAVYGLVSSSLCYVAWGAATEGWMLYAAMVANVFGFSI